MHKITSCKELRNVIQLLEEDQAIKGRLLKKQVCITFESLKPINILKSTLKDISSSPYLIENIVGSAVGIATGFASKRIVVGASANIFKKLFGTVLQFSVTNLVAKNSDSIKSVIQFIGQHLLRQERKER